MSQLASELYDAASIVDRTSFQPYTEKRQKSKALDRNAKYKEVDIGMTTADQFAYNAICARITPSRLPPLQAQIDDLTIFELMTIVFVENRFTKECLAKNWSGVFQSTGYPLPHRRQQGRPV